MRITRASITLLDFFGTGKETCMSDDLDEDASDFEALMGSMLPEYLETRYQMQDIDCSTDNVVCIVVWNEPRS